MTFNELDFISYIKILKKKLNNPSPTVEIAGVSYEEIASSQEQLEKNTENIRMYGCRYKLNNIIDYRVGEHGFNEPLGDLRANRNNNRVLNVLQASEQQLNFINEKYNFSLAKNYILLFIIIFSIYLFVKFKKKGNSGSVVINISFKFLSNPIYLLILLIIILSTIYIIYLVINKKFIFK